VSEAREGIPSAGIGESLRFVAAGLLPSLARGLFSPRRGVMKALTAADADRRAAAVLAGIRRRHGGQGAKLLGGRIVTLWGPDAIREVLDRSATEYASDSGAKGKGMAHFQPDALTLSRDAEWRDRRAFNEAVLATSEAVHPDAARFLAVVADEVAQLPASGSLGWARWETLFDRLTLRVIFGDHARDHRRLTELLEGLMGEANRLVGLGPSDDFHELSTACSRRSCATRSRAACSPASPPLRSPTRRASCTRSRTGCSRCATRSGRTPSARWRWWWPTGRCARGRARSCRRRAI
jgi:hypothetical protein